ncbi:hypothetical protein FDECE_164 [Fusarium decemcellulare]|nr:hypothetical protein FDECE_164 [Fusarium decemcellulare]
MITLPSSCSAVHVCTISHTRSTTASSSSPSSSPSPLTICLSTFAVLLFCPTFATACLPPLLLPSASSTILTLYCIFRRVVGSRNTRTRSALNPISLKNALSSAGLNVAVKHTTGTPKSCNVSPNRPICGRNVLLYCKTVWHSSTTTLSNFSCACMRSMNTLKPLPTADSGVTNINDAARCTPPLLHTYASIPIFVHRTAMSSSNATNGVITTVTPSGVQYAGNMNVKLLPPPVGVICTIGHSPRATARITGSCNPLNSAAGPIICFNCPCMSMRCNRPNRCRRICSRSPLNGARPRLSPNRSVRSSAPNPKNRCHCMLAIRNFSRLRIVPNSPCLNNRA